MGRSDYSKPRARIEIDGQLFDSFTHKSFFSSVNVKLRTGEQSECEFAVVDENYSFLDDYTREGGIPMAECFVWLGNGEELGEPVFEGLLAGVDHGDNLTTFRFYDRSFKMRIEQKTEHHMGMDIAVMKKLVERNGLNFAGPTDAKGLPVTSAKHKAFKGVPLKSAKQEGQTDWAFVKRIAEDAGLVTFTRGATFYALTPARTGEPLLTLSARDALVLRGGDQSHRLPENLEGRPGTVEVRSRGRGGRRLSGVSDKSPRGHKIVVINKSIKGVSQSELARRAAARKELQREHAFNCRVRTLFLPDEHVDVRQTIELHDYGQLFSGKYLVDSVYHSFAPGKLFCDFDLYRDTEDF